MRRPMGRRDNTHDQSPEDRERPMTQAFSLSPRAGTARLCLAGLLSLSVGLGPVLAQHGPAQGDGPGQAQGRGTAQGQPRKAPEGRRLPPDATTEHSIDGPNGRALAFTATAGSLALVDEEGKLQSEIAFIAYTKAGKPEEAAARPITFGVNGGPGAASAYLNIGAIGPWRLPTDGPSISP
ncbi:MAG: peptidase S10, partial [Methylorubrum extorquens]